MSERKRGSRRRSGTGGFVALIGAFNVDRYFSWMQEPETLAARQPAIAGEEFPIFRDLAREFSREGRLVSEAEWLRYRRSVLGPEAQ